MPDEARLRAWALRYLACYATSQARLAAYLRRKAVRALERQGLKPDPSLAQVIARVVQHCAQLGLVDDRAHARARLRRLVRRGASPMRLRADLARRGIAPQLAAEELAEIAAELGEEPEHAAARAFLQRRGLMPADEQGWTAERRRRALAALARAGFSRAVASAVVTEAASGSAEEGTDGCAGR